MKIVVMAVVLLRKNGEIFQWLHHKTVFAQLHKCVIVTSLTKFDRSTFHVAPLIQLSWAGRRSGPALKPSHCMV
jgi:hypothetical protein